MKYSIIAATSLFCFSALASKPVIARHDLTYAAGTGIEDIQMLFGGEEEEISGVINKTELRRTFLNNMIGIYRCYAASYRESKIEGKLSVHFTLKSGKSLAKPSKVKATSTDLSSQDFTDCVEKYISKISMPAPTDTATAEVTMPIFARLRSTTSVED